RKAKSDKALKPRERPRDLAQTSVAAPERRKRERPGQANGAHPPSTSMEHEPNGGPVKKPAALDLTEKAKDLVRLAREQGHLTYEDVNDALSEEVVTPDDLDRVLTKLRTLDIEIIDPAEVDRVRPVGAEDEEGERFD